MITEAYTCIKSFSLGLGLLSYFILHVNCYDENSQAVLHWMYSHPSSYCLGCYFVVNVIIILMFHGKQWQVTDFFNSILKIRYAVFFSHRQIAIHITNRELYVR